MPDSALLTLLRKAYLKIPENYPKQPTRYKGFYQESTVSVRNGVFMGNMQVKFMTKISLCMS